MYLFYHVNIGRGISLYHCKAYCANSHYPRTPTVELLLPPLDNWITAKNNRCNLAGISTLSHPKKENWWGRSEDRA
jgi:hypothetical protein